MPRFTIHTYGCRVNQADSATLARRLEDADWERSSEPEADLVVLNTCTVTHRSDADVRKEVHRLQRERPDAKIVVTGCMAERVPNQVVQLGIHGLLGNADKPRLAELAAQVRTSEGPVVLRSDIRTGPPPVEPFAGVLDRSRPFIKIQDGCDAHCTYCIIPSVRGGARSASVSRVRSTVEALVAAGHREIVLTGVHLGTYAEPGGLEGLVRALLAIPGLGRLRLSCIEPMAFPRKLIELLAEEPRLAPHLHLPLQSGSGRTLKRMVRPYRPADYVELMQSVRQAQPRVCLGTDVIVGFPGETDRDFEETLATLEAADVDYAHVFSYSDREGTPSTRLSGKVDARVIKERSRSLNDWSRRRWLRFLQDRGGQIREAVTLQTKDGQLQLLTDDYVPVDVSDEGNATFSPNHPVSVRIQGIRGTRCTGKLV